MVGDKVTAQDVNNTGEMVWNNGAQVRDLNNDKIVNITGDVSAANIYNKDDMDIDGNVITTGNILNQGYSTDLYITGNVNAANITNEGTTQINGNLITSANINNSKSFTVNGHTNAVDISNTDTLLLKNGAEIHDLTNSKTAIIQNGLTANKITNTDTINIEKGSSTVSTIDNTATVNIKDADNFTLTTGINGETTGTVNIDTSKFQTNGNIRNQDVNATDSTLTFGNNGDVLKNSTLNVTNTKVNTNDGTYTNYTMDKLDSSLNSRWNIDLYLDKNEQKADTFTLTNGGSGYIYISSINVGGNVINNCDDNERHILQIIKSAVPDAPQLTYDEAKVLNQATANMTSDIIFAKEFGLRTTNTLNDTLEIRGWMDTFREWAINDRGEFNRDTMSYEFPATKTFTFVDDSTVKLTKDTDEFVGNDLTINGADNIYDVDGHEFLQTINDDQTITFKDINIINNNSNPTENNGVFNLQDTSYDKDIVNNNELHLTGEITLADVTNNKTMDFNGTLLTTDNVTNNDDIDITGNIIVNNDIENNKTIDITGDIAIGNNLTNNTNGIINIDGNLEINNNINNSDTIHVTGDTSVGNEITNTGNITIEGNLTDGKGITNNGNGSALNVTGNVDVTDGNLNNDGDTTINGNLTISDNLTNTGNITIDKDVTIGNNFNSNGTSSDPGITTIGSNLEVGGSVYISDSDSLNVSKDVTIADSFTNNGTTKIDGNLDVQNEIKNQKDLTVDGHVNSDTIINNNNLVINSGTNFNEFTNNGDADIIGATKGNKVTNNGDLDIIGPVDLKDLINTQNVTITGDTNINKTDNSGSLTINDSKFTFDTITSGSRGDLNLNNTTVNFTDKIENQNISAINGSVINAQSTYNFNNDSLLMANSTMNIDTLMLQPLHFNTFGMGDGSTININNSQVDFTTETMGRITADNYIQAGPDSVLHLNNLSLLNVPDKTQSVITMPFADDTFRTNVQYHGTDEVYSPIYKYGTAYNWRDGKMYFIRGGWLNPSTGEIEYPSNPSKMYNPGIMASSVAAQTGAVATINQTFAYAFQNSDNFMGYPSAERIAAINKNRIALSETDVIDGGNSQFEAQENASIWVKPYTTFESVPLKNGPKVSNVIYGTMIGFDTDLKPMNNGWARTYTGYLGYNGASQRYMGVDLTQNGVLLGGTTTFYKKNFFNATTISSGISFSENNSMYGRDHSKMLFAGIGNKTGYNFEFKDGKFIVQPNLLLAYTFVNTFDYTNAAGVNIHTKPLHSIQVAPGIKVIANTKSGWQPYATVGMVWNFMDKQRVTADYTVNLPATSIKPYFQYGVGIQKVIKNNFMGFGQVTMHNGGRNGVTLSAGFRWNIDTSKFKKHNSKVKNVKNQTQGTTAAQNTKPTAHIIKSIDDIRGKDNTVTRETKLQNINNIKTTQITKEKAYSADLLNKTTVIKPIKQNKVETFKAENPIVPVTGTNNTSDNAQLSKVLQKIDTITDNKNSSNTAVNPSEDREIETSVRNIQNAIATNEVGDITPNTEFESTKTVIKSMNVSTKSRNLQRYYEILDAE